jgi:hypothetical protein
MQGHVLQRQQLDTAIPGQAQELQGFKVCRPHQVMLARVVQQPGGDLAQFSNSAVQVPLDAGDARDRADLSVDRPEHP